MYISSPNVDFWWNLGIAHGFELKGNPLELTSRAGMRIDQQEVLTHDTIERVGENCMNNPGSKLVWFDSVKISGIIQMNIYKPNAKKPQ